MGDVIPDSVAGAQLLEALAGKCSLCGADCGDAFFAFFLPDEDGDVCRDCIVLATSYVNLRRAGYGREAALQEIGKGSERREAA